MSKQIYLGLPYEVKVEDEKTGVLVSFKFNLTAIGGDVWVTDTRAPMFLTDSLDSFFMKQIIKRVGSAARQKAIEEARRRLDKRQEELIATL
jgi:hypothetical protein